MPTASPADRARFITGLRDLASFLGARPGFPVPRHGALILVFPDGADHAERRADIGRLAVDLGASPEDDGGHYTAEPNFGPVQYRLVGVEDDPSDVGEAA